MYPSAIPNLLQLINRSFQFIYETYREISSSNESNLFKEVDPYCPRFYTENVT